MIDTGYVRTMARYNLWQNNQIRRVSEAMTLDELLQDRGLFFGSILGTLNHLLWGDRIWMCRFDPSVEKPAGGISDSVNLCTDLAAWSRERAHSDTQITTWAQQLDAAALGGDLAWYSGAAGRDVIRPLSLCVTHMFNHQTHHRGQVHAMLTATGADAPVSDLFLMPEDV